MPDPQQVEPPVGPGMVSQMAETRLGQARLLHSRTLTSCIIVEGVALYLTVLILLTGAYGFAALWLGMTSLMVGIVFAYDRIMAPNGITPANVRRYLRGHVVISTTTGLVWGGLAMAFLDPVSLMKLFIAINIVFSISVGGMLPSAEYRPSFLGLSTAAILPVAGYWLITVDGPLRLIGLGLLIYYGFGLLVSMRAEVQTIEAIAAQQHRELMQQLQDRNQAIERASAAKSRFLAAASHDMSQPLQAQGFLISALRQTLDRSDQSALLDKIEACWRSQQQLLRALVESARLDSGAIIVKPHVFDLAEVGQNLFDEFNGPAMDRGVTLSLQCETAPVETDPLLVSRILGNLLSNAVKFTPAGGHVDFHIGPRDGDRVFAEVADNGPGIAEADQARVFEEYVQADVPLDGPQQGLGLGLAIVRQLTGKLGVEFDFRSEPGQGTRASVTLPRAAHDALPADERTRAVTEFATSPFIVLVEDDPAVRDSLSILLTDWGCRIVAGASGSQTLELLAWADAEPDFLIVDKHLSENEDGLDVIAAIRAEVAATVPAVLLTGDIYEFDRLAGEPDIDVIAKPADPQELHRHLASALSASAQLRTA